MNIQQLFRRQYSFEEVLFCILLVTIPLSYFGFFGQYNTELLSLIALIGVIPMYLSTFEAIRERNWASMDLLASVTLTLTIIQGEWFSVIFITLMLTAARILGTLSEQRTEKSLQSLLDLRPETAKVERAGTLVMVATSEIQLGDIVVVDAGERIPVDGKVLTGEAAVDESSLTGESLPIDKEVGNEVKSSTLLLSGSLHIQTESIGKDTLIERIITLVQSATTEKPAIETLGQKFGKAYLLTAFVGAAALLLVTHNIPLVLAVVLVVCADDIAIAIPLTYLRALGSAAKKGIVIKGGRFLEAFGKVDTIVFDKTGTLTMGKPKVMQVVTADGTNEQELLQLAAQVASRSSHPLSKALMQHLEKQSIAFTALVSGEVVAGMGVTAEGANGTIFFGRRDFLVKQGITLADMFEDEEEEALEKGYTISYVTEGNVVRGLVVFGDTLREEARAVIEDLRSLGITKMIMLTGDNNRAAENVAKSLGLDEFYGGLLPEDKVEKLRELTATRVVAMVGDGVNDAAALALAHVGIAMGGLGSDGAIESADIVLMRDNLDALPQTIRLARRVRAIAVQDFYIWGVTNILGLGLVFTSVIGPLGAALYNFLSDFLPLFNSLRAKMVK
jgi:heavy metal translocating P-type ATPase